MAGRKEKKKKVVCARCQSEHTLYPSAHQNKCLFYSDLKAPIKQHPLEDSAAHVCIARTSSGGVAFACTCLACAHNIRASLADGLMVALRTYDTKSNVKKHVKGIANNYLLTLAEFEVCTLNPLVLVSAV